MVSNQETGVNYSIELSTLGLNRRDSDEVEKEDEEEVPTHLNTINSSGGFLVVSTDKLSVQYTSVNLHGHDVGVIQANCPAPSRRLVYYFEIFVKNAGAKGQIAIGFSSEHFKMRRQPGWEANSYGYHGDDGFLYRGQGKGESFGPTFTSGDTVGGGINYASQECFFTKNGELVGKLYKDVKGPLYPTIAVHSQNEEVNVNFGQKPFVFDIKAFALEERLKQQMTIEKISLPLNVSHGIVRSYLIHYGYQDTLNSFDMASRSTLPPIPVAQENGSTEQGDGYALGHRKILRQLIRSGDIDAAFDKLREWYPQIVQDDNSTICFLLHCQKFVELVQVGELEGAVRYARVELAKFFENASLVAILKTCVALLAYEDPSKSPVGYLLGMGQREVVADAVNAMVLSTNPEAKDSLSCTRSHLEKLLRQLSACCLERRALYGGQGEAFHLQRVLQNVKGGK
ncbi:B30.2/SPRY domain [Macleaya cordata]|uniref:B30.2/SPRY domain n=1 Tax=Macleaya cordata TaxID=56857 RepID=A0A200R0Y0_MACCD|nr:B30.2/SPRY domain [Macleaya cordata]